LTELSKKLRKAEIDVQELKKILSENKSLENFKQLENHLSALDTKLNTFRENGKTFKRVLS
jgi:5-bromo-4-chloroindolyl phosphate hydrolysis protein